MKFPKTVKKLVNTSVEKVYPKFVENPACTLSGWKWKLLDKYKNRKITILEMEPHVRMIRLNHLPDPPPTESLFEGAKTFTLAFPWTQFTFFMGKMLVGFKKEPGNPFGPLIFPPLPNIYNEGQVCFGECNAPTNRMSLEKAVNFLGWFWMSEFDLYPILHWRGLVHLMQIWGGSEKSVDNPQPNLTVDPQPILTGFGRWQEASKDRDFWKDIKIFQHYRIESIIKNRVGYTTW